MALVRGGSSIPRRRGRQPFEGGGWRQDMILPIFPKNCMKLRRVWSVESARPLDPPVLVVILKHCELLFLLLLLLFVCFVF